MPYIRWEDKEAKVFRIVNPNGLAQLWGNHKVNAVEKKLVISGISCHVPDLVFTANGIGTGEDETESRHRATEGHQPPGH